MYSISFSPRLQTAEGIPCQAKQRKETIARSIRSRKRSRTHEVARTEVLVISVPCDTSAGPLLYRISGSGTSSRSWSNWQPSISLLVSAVSFLMPHLVTKVSPRFPDPKTASQSQSRPTVNTRVCTIAVFQILNPGFLLVLQGFPDMICPLSRLAVPSFARGETRLHVCHLYVYIYICLDI